MRILTYIENLCKLLTLIKGCGRIDIDGLVQVLSFIFFGCMDIRIFAKDKPRIFKHNSGSGFLALVSNSWEINVSDVYRNSHRTII